MDKRFVPIEPVRSMIKLLEKRYGSISQASHATGIPYNTLKDIKLPERGKTQVTRRTAERIRAAAEAPVKVVPTMWERRFVAVDRVQPLVAFLEKSYGTIREAARVTGIPETSLRNIRNAAHPWTAKETARKVVAAVQEVRYGNRSWSSFEIEEVPRFVAPKEKKLSRRFTRGNVA